jgi:hypothetical protein
MLTRLQTSSAVLVDSYRAFVDAKMDVLRRWQAAIVRLARKHNEPVRTYDVPMDGGVWYV